MVADPHDPRPEQAIKREIAGRRTVRCAGQHQHDVQAEAGACGRG